MVPPATHRRVQWKQPAAKLFYFDSKVSTSTCPWPQTAPLTAFAAFVPPKSPIPSAILLMSLVQAMALHTMASLPIPSEPVVLWLCSSVDVTPMSSNSLVAGTATKCYAICT
eukprot:14916090-Ditylum_brightwellii.AAC.2